MGNGISDACPERIIGDQQKKLAVSYFIGTCNRRIMTLLLQSFANGRIIKGGSD
jgi:hypothetical protein